MTLLEQIQAREPINSAEFHKEFHFAGQKKHEIFTGRLELMQSIYDSGIPIYCDQSYYVQEQTLYPVIKDGEHFKCGVYKKFEDWRDCHYYSLYEDNVGNQVWRMTGGRYD